MSNWSAYWRMPSPKEMEKLARERPAEAPDIEDGWWNSVLNDPRAAGARRRPIQQCRLNEIPRPLLRVECSRCARVGSLPRRRRPRQEVARTLAKPLDHGRLHL